MSLLSIFSVFKTAYHIFMFCPEIIILKERGGGHAFLRGFCAGRKLFSKTILKPESSIWVIAAV